MAILRECRVVKVVSEEINLNQLKLTRIEKVVTNELSVEDKNHSVPKFLILKLLGINLRGQIR